MIRTHLKSDGESLSPVCLENVYRPDQTRFNERGNRFGKKIIGVNKRQTRDLSEG